jgi:RNA polymerase sigma factor (sigma-70 family)
MSSASPVVEADEVLRDGELLKLFVEKMDETAFAMIIQRHRGLIMGACLRVLGNEADAQDAFQATFLMLAKKASSIRQGETLASWLYRVAYRMSLDLKASLARRREMESKAMEGSESMFQESSSDKDKLWQELKPVLEEELNKLPEKFRVPLILCYLEGKTNDQAAQELKCPAGSLWWRLERGSELLKKRLTQRGVVLTTAVLTSVLAENALAAKVPGVIIHQTTQAAILIASGKEVSGVSATAISLFKGALKKMYIKKLQMIGTILLLGVVGIVMVLASEKSGTLDRYTSSEIKEAPSVTMEDSSIASAPDPQSEENKKVMESKKMEVVMASAEKSVIEQTAGSGMQGNPVLTGSAALVSSPTLTAQNQRSDVLIKKIEVVESETPHYEISNQVFPEIPKRDSVKKWIVIQAELDLNVESLDEVQVKFYVVGQYGNQQKTTDPKEWDNLIATVNVVNMQKNTGGKKNVVPVFMGSNTVKKYGEPNIQNMIPEVAVQVWSKGVLQDEFFWKKVGDRFWERKQPKSGILLNLLQSPWWPAFAGVYEQVKPTPQAQP